MSTDHTQTQSAPPRAAYPPLSALHRSRADRKLAGVSGGLGRYAGVDPLIFRILFVVLTFFGGSGVILYVLGWLLVPDDGEEQSEGQRLFSGSSRSSLSRAVALVAVLVVSLAIAGAMLDTGPGLGGLGALVVVGLAVVLLLNRDQRPATDQTPTTYGPVPPPDPGAYGQTPGTAYATTAPGATGYSPPPPGPPTYVPGPPLPPAPPRERSVLGRVTFFSALIVVGLMVGWNSVGDDDFRVVAILGAALAVVGAGLVVGAFMGRARGLIALGIFLSLATSAAAVSYDHLSGGVGERTWAPETVAAAERSFRLGVGDAELDLTRLPAGSTVDVEARLGIGSLRITVPSDAQVVVDGSVEAGDMQLLDVEPIDGTDLHLSTTSIDPPGVTRSGTQITIDAEVGLGELEVRRATS